MKQCEKCGQLSYESKEDFKKHLGDAYLLAIKDKEFLEWLEKGVKK